RTQGGIGQVPAVPRQKIIDSVRRGDGHVQRIGRGFRRKRLSMEQRLGQSQGFGRRLQQSQWGQDHLPLPGSLRITGPRFLKHQLRSTEFKLFAAVLPPFLGNLLMPRDDNISAGPGRQIADEGGLDIDLWLHGSSRHAMSRTSDHKSWYGLPGLVCKCVDFVLPPPTNAEDFCSRIESVLVLGPRPSPTAGCSSARGRGCTVSRGRRKALLGEQAIGATV